MGKPSTINKNRDADKKRLQHYFGNQKKSKKKRGLMEQPPIS
jgi:hypothetical protein